MAALNAPLKVATQDALKVSPIALLINQTAGRLIHMLTMTQSGRSHIKFVFI